MGNLAGVNSRGWQLEIGQYTDFEEIQRYLLDLGLRNQATKRKKVKVNITGAVEFDFKSQRAPRWTLFANPI